KKNRRCAMQSKKNQRFCAEHLKLEASEGVTDNKDNIDARVPCPLDPKHTVKQRDLKTHLQKCNARPAESPEPWYNKDINAELHLSKEGQETKNTGLDLSLNSENEPALFRKLFGVLETYNRKVPSLESKIQKHAGLDSWLSKKENKKHIVQQASLIGAMKETDLLSRKNVYVEFGCGKAELSRTVNACVIFDTVLEKKEVGADQHDLKNNLIYGFGLIDRGVNRMKMDNKIVSDCEGSQLHPQIKRSRIDIQHLDLDKFMEYMQHLSIVAISKHLCGAATDLTLKLILNSKKSRDALDGVVVAMCCRHVCDYGQFLPQSRDFLAKNGVVGAREFLVLKKIVTWAVCGKREGQEDKHESGYTYEERERLGLIARRMIDDSRVDAINSLMENNKAELFLYADKESTLENHCLRV
ncbi:DUF715-domain-containing protein, partial [Metschnikowia bicuspidata var. bicuspidata NRRL YB-4993]